MSRFLIPSAADADPTEDHSHPGPNGVEVRHSHDKKAADEFMPLTGIHRHVEFGLKFNLPDSGSVKGDVPGHEFHGNQYTSGGGGESHDSSKPPQFRGIIHNGQPADILELRGHPKVGNVDVLRVREGSQTHYRSRVNNEEDGYKPEPWRAASQAHLQAAGIR